MSTVCEVPRLCVQVIVCVDPAPQVTAVVGAVTATRGMIVKLTSLVSDTPAAPAQATWTRACVVGGPPTSHEYVPDVAVVVATVVIGLQVPPPSRLRLMFTG